MKEQVKDLLRETLQLEYEKRDASFAMNDAAKNAENEFGIDKQVLKKCKDYFYYHTLGWMNGDPLTLNKEEKFKDRISPIFIKLKEVVSNLQRCGQIDLLDDYLAAMDIQGIHIKIDHKDPDIADVDIIKDIIDSMCGWQKVICENADIIKDEHAPQSEELNFTPKSKYKEVFNLYNRKINGKDVDDKIRDKVAFCEMYESALNQVDDIKGS